VRLLVGPSFSQLLCNPKSIGISRHIEMQDLPPVVADDEKAVQNTKRERWDGESTGHPAEEMSERRDHSRNHIGKVRIEVCAKSFILQAYKVLAGHR
jgi:hypothetical protein